MAKRVSNKQWFDRFILNIPYDHNFEFDASFCYQTLMTKKMRKMTSSSNSSYFLAMITHKPKIMVDLLNLIEKVSSFKGITKDKMVFVHGKIDGMERWNSYCYKQSYTNSFEYKNAKYGMTEEEFKLFNKSRAITEELCIQRHGEIKGKELWKSYCERQSYTNSEEYLGAERYVSVNRLKSHTFDVYVERYGDPEIAIKKLHEYYDGMQLSYSKISQQLFFTLIGDSVFKDKSIYFAEYNKEYGVFDTVLKKYYKFDFVCIELKLAIEFQGDHYHGNPKLYNPSDKLRGRGQQKTASEAWITDNEKKCVIERERGFDIIQIWESDYIDNPKLIIEEIINYAKTRI